MLTQAVILVIVIAVALSSFLVYKKLNKIHYIEYTEASSSTYKVHYKDNAFFEEEWLAPGQSYVSSLVDDIRTDFHYELHMDTSNVAFDYTYELVAQTVISDKTSGAHIYDPIDVIIPKTTKSVSGSDSFVVEESAIIDFAAYNSLATRFIEIYGLKNAKAALWVTLKVNVLSASDEFDMNNENTHSVSMLVPLCDINFSIENMNSLPSGESKILACKSNDNQKMYLGCSIAMSLLALLLATVLVLFAYLTKNEDVTYANKVRKLLSAYRSFIQRIYGEFDATGYQIVQIKSFTELLSIRDTIQSPVLMSENKDETRAQFLVPTNTKILYLYEIRVENYEELYGAHPEWVDDSVIKIDAPAKEEPATALEPIEVEAMAEPVAEPVAEVVYRDEYDYVPTDKLRMDFYAELDKLRRDLLESKETKETVQTVPGTSSGNMKFGHFTAGRDVNIHYHEMPDEKFLKKMLAGDNNDEDPDPDGGEEIPEVEAEELTAREVVAEVAVEETEEAIEEATEEVTAETTEEVVEEAEAEETYEEMPEVLPEEEFEVEIVEEPVTELAEEPIMELSEQSAESYSEDADSDGSIVFYDENENKLSIKCSRSCLANLIQSENETTKAFYSELKNYILSFKGVRARMSWRHESFNKGRTQLFKLKIRGKSICLYCALDPNEFDVNKYHQKTVDAKVFEQVPMLVKIKSPGGLKRAKRLVDIVMERNALVTKPTYVAEDFVALHPYERTQALIDRGLIKILVPEGYVVVDPHHIVKAEKMQKILEARAAKKALLAEKRQAEKEARLAEKARLAEEARLAKEAKLAEEARLAEEQLQKEIEIALAEPDVELKDIDYVDVVDETYEANEQQPGVEVVNVVWPEHARRNKLYRYDPNGQKLEENDIVLVPTKDVNKNKDVVRKATVAYGNHLVDPANIKHPLKKIIMVIKHKVEEALAADTDAPKKDSKKKNNKNTK